MKKNRGITLIALIITIIVMLILVSVSISIALNTGLFKTASDATKNWKTAQEEESKMQIEIGGKKYDSIEDYLAGAESIPKIHNWQYVDESTREEIRCTCDVCKAFDDGDSTGRTLKIGQQIGETENKTASTSITAAKSGYDTDQTLVLDAEETKWVVFGFEDKNGDTKNETLLLTTEHPTTNKITFKGAASYNNCIDEINRMCKELYGENARGMTIEDVNKALGYTPAGGMYYLNNEFSTTGNLTTKLKNLGEDYGNMWTAITDYNTNNLDGVFYDPSNPDGVKDNGVVLGEYTLDGYFYAIDSTVGAPTGVPQVSSEISTTTKAMIFGSEKTSYGYWLASRGVYAYSYCAHSGPGSVNYGSAGSYFGLFYSFGNSSDDEFPVRALVSLNSEIPAGGTVLEFSGTSSSGPNK